MKMIETEDQLWEYIKNLFIIISHVVGIIERVRKSLIRRMEDWTFAEGRDYEYLFHLL